MMDVDITCVVLMGMPMSEVPMIARALLYRAFSPGWAGLGKD